MPDYPETIEEFREWCEEQGAEIWEGDGIVCNFRDQSVSLEVVGDDFDEQLHYGTYESDTEVTITDPEMVYENGTLIARDPDDPIGTNIRIDPEGFY